MKGRDVVKRVKNAVVTLSKAHPEAVRLLLAFFAGAIVGGAIVWKLA